MRALEFITGHLIYNPAYTYKFQLKTTIISSMIFDGIIMSKVLFLSPWNPCLKSNGTGLLILFLVKDFKDFKNNFFLKEIAKFLSFSCMYSDCLHIFTVWVVQRPIQSFLFVFRCQDDHHCWSYGIKMDNRTST